MLTLTSFSSSERSSAILSSTGATAWHGPHHSAQKSTMTGLSLFRTSSSKVAVVTAVDIRIFLSSDGALLVTRGASEVFPTGNTLEHMARLFAPLPRVPDHPALERGVLERWDRERTFERLREQNAGGPRFSFVDGPITANNPMGVHHAWGRSLKDV